MVRGCQAPGASQRSPEGRGSEYGGVYRAELHKRALQWKRTTAYLAPGKACRGMARRRGFGSGDAERPAPSIPRNRSSFGPRNGAIQHPARPEPSWVPGRNPVDPGRRNLSCVCTEMSFLRDLRNPSCGWKKAAFGRLGSATRSRGNLRCATFRCRRLILSSHHPQVSARQKYILLFQSSVFDIDCG